jgi:hypothetical protein
MPELASGTRRPDTVGEHDKRIRRFESSGARDGTNRYGRPAVRWTCASILGGAVGANYPVPPHSSQPSHPALAELMRIPALGLRYEAGRPIVPRSVSRRGL